MALKKFEKSILEDITEVLLPKTENLSVSVSQREHFGEEVGVYIENASKQTSITIRFSLFIIQILPIFIFLSPFSKGYPLPFTRLSEENRALFIKKMNESSLYVFRGMLTLLKAIILQKYCSGDEVKKEIDYQVDLSGDKNPLPTLIKENIFEFENPQENFEIECEVIVIGSGAGGAVIAKELAEKGFEVVVVEEGFRHSSEEFNGEPLDMFSLLYRDNGTTTTFPLPSYPLPPIIPLPMGKCLGGTTVVNSSTCYRTPDYLLENWSEEGLKDLSPEDMKPFFDKVEDNLSVHPASLELMGEANAKTMEGATSMGYETEPLDKNASGCDGTGVCQYGCPIDAKRDMQTTYVRWATQAGARFYTGFEVKWFSSKFLTRYVLVIL